MPEVPTGEGFSGSGPCRRGGYLINGSMKVLTPDGDLIPVFDNPYLPTSKSLLAQLVERVTSMSV